MRTDPRPEEVRRLVEHVLTDFGASQAALEEMDETILIDRGRYVARSYRLDDYLAMWLLEIGIVQFYSADGDMLATLNLFESLEPQRMAA
jgi:hypothetical protein